jgi:hypothetical protein
MGISFRVGTFAALFNDTDDNFRITDFGGWWSRAQPRAELVPSGAGPGAAAVGPWDDSESYYTLTGVIRELDRVQLHTYRRQLLTALPADTEAVIEALDPDDDDLQIFVRLYDKPDVTMIGETLLQFTIPLVATDPYKYLTTSSGLTGTVGVFAGSEWFLEPTIPAAGSELLPANVADGTDTSSNTTGWTAGGAYAVLSSDTTKFYAGARSLKIACTAATDTAYLTYQDHTNVTAGLRYVFGTRVTADAAVKLRALIQWRDNADVSKGTSESTLVTVPIDGTWAEIRVADVAPAGATRAELVLRRNDSGAGNYTGNVYTDAWTLKAQAQPYVAFTLDTVPTPDDWDLLFTQAAPSSAFPEFVLLTSNGDTTSRRVTIEVTGPLTQGDWWVTNEATGDQLWADLSLQSTQTVVFDCFNQTATLNGADISDLVFGDFLTLEPGAGNVFRLVSGVQSAGFATIVALPAYL